MLLSLTLAGQDLSSDRTINAVFNKNEIIDLQKILNFFDKQICTIVQGENKNINKCYISYLEQLYNDRESGNIKISIPFDEQKNIYKKLSDSTFFQIWSFNKYWYHNNLDTLRGIELNRHGKYAKYLKLVGLDYVQFNEYYEELQECGDMCPTMTTEVLVNYKDYKISDVRVKLFLAIHYLTLNDKWTRKEKY